MKTLITLFVVCVIFAGCVTYSQLFINANGEIQRCGSYGGGMIGMAMASNIMNDCIASMKAAGYMELESAGMIGVRFSTSNNDTIARVLKVIDSSPARKADIQPGDIFKKVNNTDVGNFRDVCVLLFGKVGTSVDIVIQRDGKLISLKLIRASYIEVYGNP